MNVGVSGLGVTSITDTGHAFSVRSAGCGFGPVANIDTLASRAAAMKPTPATKRRPRGWAVSIFSRANISFLSQIGYVGRPGREPQPRLPAPVPDQVDEAAHALGGVAVTGLQQREQRRNDDEHEQGGEGQAEAEGDGDRRHVEGQRR